jgi:type VI secretion system protein ImpC
MDGKTGAEELIAKVLMATRAAASRWPPARPSPEEEGGETRPTGETMAKPSPNPARPAASSRFEVSEFASLLQKEFKPKTDEAKSAVEQRRADAGAAGAGQHDPADRRRRRQVDRGDHRRDRRKLSEQVNEILHHEDFQKLEGAWRGLHYLVNNTETDEMLKIRVMNISKKDLGKTLKKYKGTAWDQSPIFKKIYEEEFGQFGGEPYGCLVGDYYFDHSPPDVELLGEMAKIAAAAHAPFIAGASPDG